MDWPGSSDISLNDVSLVGGIDKVVCWPLSHFLMILLKGGNDIPVCNWRLILSATGLVDVELKYSYCC